jgi:hypothetical protein
VKQRVTKLATLTAAVLTHEVSEAVIAERGAIRWGEVT